MDANSSLTDLHKALSDAHVGDYSWAEKSDAVGTIYGIAKARKEAGSVEPGEQRSLDALVANSRAYSKHLRRHTPVRSVDW
jgi:hypothetical protein